MRALYNLLWWLALPWLPLRLWWRMTELSSGHAFRRDDALHHGEDAKSNAVWVLTAVQTKNVDPTVSTRLKPRARWS